VKLHVYISVYHIQGYTVHNSAVTVYDAARVVISVINHKGYHTATTASYSNVTKC